MTLRVARPADASSIAAISIEVWVGTYLKRGVNADYAGFALQEFTAENALAQITDPAQRITVSQNAEGIDGFIRLIQGSAAPVPGCSTLEIATFYVQPRHHGSGIGKRLLDAAIQHGRQLATPSLWLTTNAENTPAIGFYLALGFELVGETTFQIGDASYPNNVYRLTL